MIAVIAHGYAHVLTETGQVVSTKCSDLNDTAHIVLKGTEFQQRDPAEMDLTGGDMEVISMTLNNLSQIFATDEERVPRSEKLPTAVPQVAEKFV